MCLFQYRNFDLVWKQSHWKLFFLLLSFHCSVLKIQIISDFFWEISPSVVIKPYICIKLFYSIDNTSSIPKAPNMFMIVYRIVVIDIFLGVGLQNVCQFHYLPSSFFLLDRFIQNSGNLLNLISYKTTGYFRSYLFKFCLNKFFS